VLLYEKSTKQTAGIHSAYTVAEYCQLGATKQCFVQNTWVIAKPKPERQITRSVFPTKPPDNERLCDGTGQTSPISATILCILNRCQPKKPDVVRLLGFFVPIFHSAILVDANRQKRRVDGI